MSDQNEIDSLDALANALGKTTASQRVALGISATRRPRSMAQFGWLPSATQLQRDGYRLSGAGSQARYVAPRRPDVDKLVAAAVKKERAKTSAVRHGSTQDAHRIAELEQQLHGAQTEIARLERVLAGKQR
jgi:hypothetical protein